MSDGLFGDLDIAGANEDPWKIPPDAYKCVVSEVKVGPTSNGDKVGMTIKYTITEGAYSGTTFQEWKRIPTKDEVASDPQAARAVDFLAERMANFGIPKERRNSVRAEDLQGIKLIVTTFNKQDQIRIKNVVLDTGDITDHDIDSVSSLGGLDEFRPAGTGSKFDL